MKYMQHIRFVLDGEIKTIDFSSANGLKPTTTVLKYLRSMPEHRGVKEGCGEGDCGACTVVIAEKRKNRLAYTAVNSCLLFLPMIHGKQLITVENLAERENGKIRLHPVQQAVVDMNASQCGYCTPGVVMSMFALYKNDHKPGVSVIKDALAGNLCRCTGYQPILQAALKACNNKTDDHFTRDEKRIIALLDEIASEKKSFFCRSNEQEYFRAKTLKSALSYLNKNPDALIVNGATDVALRQTKKFEKLKKILDISGIDSIKFFRNRKDGYLIGAGLSVEELKNKTIRHLPALHEILSRFASLQIRKMATVGGNIATASPVGDIIPVLFAYKAGMNLVSANQKRSLELQDFIKDYRTTALQRNELLHSVFIPRTEKNTFIKSYKVSKRKDVDISTVSAGFRLRLSDDNRVEEIILAFGGMSRRVQRAGKTENFFLGKEWSQKTVEMAMPVITEDFQPIDDVRAGKSFRYMAAQNLLLKFFYDTTNQDY